MNWTSVQCQTEVGQMFCLDGVGVLLRRAHPAGIWGFFFQGSYYAVDNKLCEESARAAVEKTVAGEMPDVVRKVNFLGD